MIQMIFFGSVFALLIHLAAGHSLAYIANDFTGGGVILVGGVVGIICGRLARQILKTPAHLWNRNRQAAKLAKKINSLKELTEIEQNQLNSLIKEGILKPIPYIYQKQWRMHVQLSNSAINDVLYY